MDAKWEKLFRVVEQYDLATKSGCVSRHFVLGAVDGRCTACVIFEGDLDALPDLRREGFGSVVQLSLGAEPKT